MSRYLVSFNNPYLFDTNVNYGMSGYYFQRFYYDWYEQRMGGRVNLGYQFRPDLVGTIGLRAENVRIEDPRIADSRSGPGVGEQRAVQHHLAQINDTRDNTFFPTEGRYINLQYEQVTGSFTYPRLTLDLRKYFVLHQRADGSGRQVLALYSYTGVSGANTPIYDRFFLGGIGTIRGFYYRDASPTFDTVVVGGDFASYGTIEYTVPITADDMFRLAFFCRRRFRLPHRAVEGNDIRISPGMGIRISVPAMGPAPIAVDFALPVVKDVERPEAAGQLRGRRGPRKLSAALFAREPVSSPACRASGGGPQSILSPKAAARALPGDSSRPAPAPYVTLELLPGDDASTELRTFDSPSRLELGCSSAACWRWPGAIALAVHQRGRAAIAAGRPWPGRAWV